MKETIKIVAWQIKDLTRIWVLLMMYALFLFSAHLSSRESIGSNVGIASKIAIMMGEAMPNIYIMWGPLIGLLISLSFAHETETGIIRTILLNPVSKSALYWGSVFYVYIVTTSLFILSSIAYIAVLDSKVFPILLSPERIQPLLIVLLNYLTLFLFIASISVAIAIAFRKTMISIATLITILLLLYYISEFPHLGSALPPQNLSSNIIFGVLSGRYNLSPTFILILIAVSLFLFSYYFFIRHIEWP